VTLAEILASVLCAAAEREYSRAQTRRASGGSWRTRPAMIRHARAIALYYNLLPERIDDDTDE
jgi:hypothetical protein